MSQPANVGGASHIGRSPNTRDGAPGASRLRAAMLLEVALPGGGALYLGRGLQGGLWLVGTVVGLMIAVAIAGRDLIPLGRSCATAGGYFGAACAPYTELAAIPLVWVAALALVWLNVRLALLANQADVRSRDARAGTGGVALIGLALALCAGGLWLVYDWLGAASAFAGYPPPLPRGFLMNQMAVEFARSALGALFVAAGAWLVGLRALGRASWRQVALAALVGTLAVWAAMLGAQYLILASAGFTPATLSDLLASQVSVMVAYLPQLILAAALGLSFAAWAAPWRAIRANAGATTSAGMAFSLVTLALVMALALVPSALHAIPTGYDILNDAGRDRLWSVAGSAALLGLSIAGAPVAARLWRRG